MKSSDQNNAPIGIFDSGIGGLTVTKAVMDELPSENILYFGDTARVPYGIKSEETVKQYALQITDFLEDQGVKMILIACNTVSATAYKTIRKRVKDIPVLDVITAGTRAALNSKQSKQHIGVIGTLATIGSSAYDKAIKKINETVEVYSKACPLLVPLAEEGWTDNDIARQTLSIYLSELKTKNLDRLILGCTHYPLFKNTIRKELNGGKTVIIDSAVSIAQMARQTLEEKNLLRSNGHGDFKCYVTDKPQRFQELAERFLGQTITDLEIVNTQRDL